MKPVAARTTSDTFELKIGWDTMFSNWKIKKTIFLKDSTFSKMWILFFNNTRTVKMTPVLTSFGYDYISCSRFVGSVQKLLNLKKLILIIDFFFVLPQGKSGWQSDPFFFGMPHFM